MKPEELRIGNLVYVPATKQIVPITAINQNIGVVVNNSLAVLPFNEIQPLPLKENLGAFTFKKGVNGLYWIEMQTHALDLMCAQGFFYPTYTEFAEMRSIEEQRVSLHRISYAHELQNLYYTLTKTEIHYDKYKLESGKQ